MVQIRPAVPADAPAVTAIFAALHTKVAVYALYRVFSVLFDNDARFLPLLLALAGLDLAALLGGAVVLLAVRVIHAPTRSSSGSTRRAAATRSPVSSRAGSTITTQ